MACTLTLKKGRARGTWLDEGGGSGDGDDAGDDCMSTLTPNHLQLT